MRRIKFTLTAVCAATLLTASLATAQSDRKTFVTFSGPVSIPGATLPAGTYVFRLADSPANRHIVHIFDRDEAKLITTLLAVPAERDEASGDPVVTFKETPSDRPPAVRYWYYAGEKGGNEFVYPRAQALMIARASGESVPAFDTDSTDIEAWKKGTVTTVSGNTATTEPTTPAPVTTEPAPAAAPVTTPAPEPTPTPMIAAPTAQPEPVGTSGRAERLPATASELPAVGLFGLLALAAALGVRTLRRSIA